MELASSYSTLTTDKRREERDHRPHFRLLVSDITFHCKRTMSLPKTAALASLLATATPFAPSAPSGRPAARLGAVSRKDSYDITLLPGDGIGPEIMESAKSVLSALCDRCGFELNLREALIGGAAIDEVNDPFPDATLEACQSADSVLLSCIGGYKWDSNPRELRPETGLLKMRKSMGLFANLRPAKVLDQLIDASTLKREVVEGVDVMVVRELTGDVYFGAPKGIDTDADGEYGGDDGDGGHWRLFTVVDVVERNENSLPSSSVIVASGKRVGYNNMIYSEGEIERIARVAGEIKEIKYPRYSVVREER